MSNFLPYDYLDMIEGDTSLNTNIFKMTTFLLYIKVIMNSVNLKLNQIKYIVWLILTIMIEF